MPSGPVTYNTFATSNSADNAQATVRKVNTLVSGQNILAVEVHQHSAYSTDLSFNFTMSCIHRRRVSLTLSAGHIFRRQTIPYGVEMENKHTRHRLSLIMVFRYQHSIILKWTPPQKLNTSCLLTPLQHPPSITISSVIQRIRFCFLPEIYFKTYPVAGSEVPLTAWILGGLWDRQ